MDSGTRVVRFDEAYGPPTATGDFSASDFVGNLECDGVNRLKLSDLGVGHLAAYFETTEYLDLIPLRQLPL